MKDKRTGKIGIENHPRLLEMIEQQLSAVEIADILNVNQETVRKFARKRGLTIKRHQLMDAHPAWKGGTTTDRRGYVLTRVALESEHGYLIRAIQKRGHRATDSNGYAPVHRIVMHNLLGRRLETGEVVDHIDGDIRNNDPSNLRLFSSNAEHLRVTLKGKVPNWTPEGKARMGGRQSRTIQTDSRP